MRARTGLFVLAFGAAGCWGRANDTGPGAVEKEMAARAARVSQMLAAPASDSGAQTPIAVWTLPAELAEISGLTVTPDGLVLAHADEQARVAVLDPRKGSLLRRFSLGGDVSGDFEGIAMVGDTAFMMTSNGKIYKFPEGGDGEEVRYQVHDTALGKECEFEGIAFDSASASLVLACKNVYVKDLEDHLVLYRVSLTDPSAPPAALSIPLDRAIGTNNWKKLHPSDITVDPASGHYVIVAAQERALLEITPAGEVVRSEALPDRHRQPEGVAITPDGLLVIGDEARKGAASITLYRWRARAASE